MELRQRVTKRYLTVVRTAPPNAISQCFTKWSSSLSTWGN